MSAIQFPKWFSRVVLRQFSAMLLNERAINPKYVLFIGQYLRPPVSNSMSYTVSIIIWFQKQESCILKKMISNLPWMGWSHFLVGRVHEATPKG